MRRFKYGWVLIAVALLAIGMVITVSRRDPPRRLLNDDDRGRDVETERSSKRELPAKEKSLPAKQSETAAILERLAPTLHESGQAAGLEDPKTRKEPIRIKTH